MGFHGIKKLLLNKKMVSKLKTPPTDWKKTFASYTSDQGLITRIYMEFKKLSSQKSMTQERNRQLNFFKGKSPNG
jgi:hypothetical protein